MKHVPLVRRRFVTAKSVARDTPRLETPAPSPSYALAGCRTARIPRTHRKLQHHNRRAPHKHHRQPRTAAPPSSFTTIPNFVRWLTIAPEITPKPRIAPNTTVRGTKSSTTAINSAIPDPILPAGSNPSFSKMYLDSAAPVNLKNKVCARMQATTI